MSDLYKGKYRGQSFRLQDWDYSSEGFYFITICTQNREHFFGEIQNGEMILSEMGKMAHTYWLEIDDQFEFIKLYEFVIMPNHVHGILEIDKSVCICRDAINRVPTNTNRVPTNKPNPTNNPNPTNPNRVPTNTNGGITGIKNPMFHDNISRVIRWYKGRCSFEMRKIHSAFKWQSLFHDHIIRNEKAFEQIKQYIIDNPKNWKEDTFYN